MENKLEMLEDVCFHLKVLEDARLIIMGMKKQVQMGKIFTQIDEAEELKQDLTAQCREEYGLYETLRARHKGRKRQPQRDKWNTNLPYTSLKIAEDISGEKITGMEWFSMDQYTAPVLLVHTAIY